MGNAESTQCPSEGDALPALPGALPNTVEEQKPEDDASEPVAMVKSHPKSDEGGAHDDNAEPSHVALDKPLKDIQRVLPIKVLPKTYADATNLAAQFPELASNILSLPLASSVAPEVSQPSAQPHFSACDQPKHTADKPNWALAPDPVPILKASANVRREYSTKPMKASQGRNASRLAIGGRLRDPRLEHIPPRMARSANQARINVENNPAPGSAVHGSDPRNVSDGIGARGRETTRLDLSSTPPNTTSSALALVQKAIQETKEAGRSASRRTGRAPGQTRPRSQNRDGRGPQGTRIVAEAAARVTSQVPKSGTTSVGLNVQVKEVRVSVQVPSIAEACTTEQYKHAQVHAEVSGPTEDLTDETAPPVSPAVVVEQGAPQSDEDRKRMETADLGTTAVSPVIAVAEVKDLSEPGVEEKTVVSIKAMDSTRRTTTEYIRRRARERSSGGSVKAVAPDPLAHTTCLDQSLLVQSAQSKQEPALERKRETVESLIPLSVVLEEASRLETPKSPASEPPRPVAESAQPTSLAHVPPVETSGFVALPDLIEDITPPSSQSNTPDSGKTVFHFNPEAMKFTPTSSPTVAIARESPTLTSMLSPSPSPLSSIAPLKHKVRPTLYFYAAAPSVEPAPVSRSFAKPVLPSPPVRQSAPEQHASKDTGIRALPPRMRVPSFVPKASPGTRDALVLAIEYAKTQHRMEAEALATAEAAEARARALDEQQLKLLHMLLPSDAGAGGSASGSTAPALRLSKTHVRSPTEPAGQSMHADDGGADALSSNAAAVGLGVHRGSVAPATMSRASVGGRGSGGRVLPTNRGHAARAGRGRVGC
ncbi:hypothetical protein HETIRDRAFT_311831 [Heterobasidion irregulare TC 32-1]|uniref:Uncharacterized protein n=1 Tax=Heterobasidion irregulare (strain TC 32-1) TaxID=747525 RepID=W4KEB6_HETIT|nr:uncharacterized protein HETIRDRAFT_311831 [Heterobasidion irregulare TC 32-1]ETW84158.1 hypothetical protein HETIRDRAFT_311831 [Heterobasidion irregulare TC 32-1]